MRFLPMQANRSGEEPVTQQKPPRLQAVTALQGTCRLGDSSSLSDSESGGRESGRAVFPKRRVAFLRARS